MTVQHDRAMVIDRSPQATYAPEQLGRTQAITPEGYLLCSEVRVARTGAMLYLPREVPEVSPAPNGQMVVIMRDADVLFSDETLSSFNGKAVTNNHPPKLISKDDTRKYQIGTMLNPRRGEGVDSEFMVADLLITDADTMAAVMARRKREVSLGYDAELEETKPGLGRQSRIIGNHIAIVDRGRAGSTCAIQDEEISMAKRKTTLMDRIRKAFRDNDETALEAALDDAPGEFAGGEGDTDGPVVVHIHNAPPAVADVAAPVVEALEETDPNEARFKALEDGMAGFGARFDELAALMKPADPPSATTDEDPEDSDTDADSSEVMDAAAKAEMIMPGYKTGTMDSAHTKRRAITDMRRDVLTRALGDTSRKASVEAVIAGVDLAKAKGVQIKAFFDAASAVARLNNNARTRGTSIPQGPMTAAKMQERIVAHRKGA